MFDACFGQMTGHWENYCKRFYDELSLRGCKVTVYGQKNPLEEIIQGIDFCPLFCHSPFIEMRSSNDFTNQVNLFESDLRQLDEGIFNAGDLLVFHSIFPPILGAIIAWTKDLLKRKAIKVALFFQFAPAEAKQSTSMSRRTYYFLRTILEKRVPLKKMAWVEDKNVIFYRSLTKDLTELVAKGTHLLFTSTDVLAKNFTVLFGANVQNLPMPGPKYEVSLSDLSIRKGEKEEQSHLPTLYIGYFGHSSLEKGGQFLEYIVRKTRQLYPKAKFVLHINPNKDSADYFDYFKKNKDPNIECYHGHLAQDEMLTLIRKIDIVLIPYSANKYATTPSAIFTESMSLKKVFILPQKTWVHREAKRYHAGYITFKKYNAHSILGALLNAVIHFEKLQRKSLTASRDFYEQNNIANYTDLFIERIKDAAVSVESG